MQIDPDQAKAEFRNASKKNGGTGVKDFMDGMGLGLIAEQVKLFSCLIYFNMVMVLLVMQQVVISMMDFYTTTKIYIYNCQLSNRKTFTCEMVSYNLIGMTIGVTYNL